MNIELNKVYNLDCLEFMKTLPDNSIDSIVTDPPYGLSQPPDIYEVLKCWMNGEPFKHSKKGFMSAEWDSFVPGPEFFKEMYRIMKPGAHIACFAGSRTQDLMGIAIRMAGFEIKDTIFFLHSSGFPKNHNIPVNIDKKLGYKPKIIGQKQAGMGTGDSFGMRQAEGSNSEAERVAPVYEATSDEAKKWEGFGTALKPAYEPIILAKKPNEKGLSIAENVLKWGTGAINIKGCRVGSETRWNSSAKSSNGSFVASPKSGVDYIGQEVEGRWPADIVHDGSDKILDMFAEFGETKSSKSSSLRKTGTNGSFLSNGGNFQTQAYGDEGSPSRMFNSLEYDEEDLDLMFYHCAKPSIADKDEGLEKYFEAKQKPGEYCLSSHNGESRLEKSLPRFNIHPTIKSTNLMRWLCKLVTPPNGLIYDPFSGSGSTGKAAGIDGFDFIGTEMDEEFCKIANIRLNFGIDNRHILASRKKPLIKNKRKINNSNDFF